MTPRVLLDVDGILADFIGAALRMINEKLNTHFTHDDVTDFNFTRALGLSAAQSAAIYRDIGSSEGFARKLAVFPGAVDGVRRLRAISEVYVVTSPWNSNATWTSDRERWLREHFGVGHERVIHAIAKHVCGGNFLVDDKTETCERWQAHHPAGVAVQWRTPHNRRDGWVGPSTDSWDELIGMIQREAA